jgi:hypothetical protein
MILDETIKTLSNFNATVQSLLIEFNSPVEEQEPTAYLWVCIVSFTDYMVSDVPGRDLIGLRISNTDNFQDKVLGISLGRCDQLKYDVAWDVPVKVIQSTAMFGLTDLLEVHLYHVRMPTGNDKRAERTKGISLSVLIANKNSIVV